MIISRKRRFIFVHVPKTGGTSLMLAYEARAAADDILIGDTPKARARAGRLKAAKAAGRLWKHSTLSDIRGLVSDEEIAEFFVVTLVRNPWERMLSYWAWACAQSFDHPAVARARALGFADFAAHPDTLAALRAYPYGAYVRGPGGAERCSLFARLEHLAEDLAPLEDHLGFRLGPLPRVNASDRPEDWRAAYDDDLAALVAEAAAEDIARFGYRF
jgi:hypothetical protein